MRHPAVRLMQAVAIVAMTMPLFGQATSSSDALADRIMDTVNLWATVVGILSALAIGAAAVNVIYQIYQVRKTGENLTNELITRMEKEIQTLKETYKLSAMKTPAEIIADARQDYEPMIAVVRNLIDHLRIDSEAKADEVTKDLASLRELVNSERARLRAEMIEKEMGTTKYVQEQVGSATRFIQEQVAAFRLPTDLEETLLRKVLNAFIRVQALSDDERRAISDALSATPQPTRASGSSENPPPAPHLVK